MKTLQECLGWHTAYADGHSTMESWFDWNDRLMEYTPSTDYLIGWVTDNVLVSSITYVPAATPQWVATFQDKNGKSCTEKSTQFRSLLVAIVRTAADEN